MAKYSTKFKLKIVQYDFSEQVGWRRMTNHFGVDQSDIRNWVARYQKYGETGLTNQNTRRQHSGECKLKIISIGAGLR